MVDGPGRPSTESPGLPGRTVPYIGKGRYGALDGMGSRLCQDERGTRRNNAARKTSSSPGGGPDEERRQDRGDSEVGPAEVAQSQVRLPGLEPANGIVCRHPHHLCVRGRREEQKAPGVGKPGHAHAPPSPAFKEESHGGVLNGMHLPQAAKEVNHCRLSRYPVRAARTSRASPSPWAAPMSWWL